MSKDWLADITSPSRTIKGKVELYTGSTLADTYEANTKLSAIKVERTPTHGAFFGYTIAQKVTVKLINKDNDVVINDGDKLKAYIGTSEEYANLPIFTVTGTTRDETKGTIEAIGYDLIHTAAEHTLNEISITFPADIMDYARAIAAFLGTEVIEDFGSTYYYPITYTDEAPPNYEGTESLREVLEDIAQATGTICFVDGDNNLRFKHLENATVGTIDKSQYFTLKVSNPLTLTKISATTELGDNLATGTDGGFNQVIHNNPFFELHTEDAIAAIEIMLYGYNGIKIYPYNIKWRANPALDIGDCVEVTLKDGSTIPLIYLGETLNYTGGMSAISEWTETEQNKISANPINIGEAIKQTYAKVDKVNKQIDMVVSESSANSEAIAALQLNTESINASVSSIEKNTTDALEDMNEEVSTLKTKVDATITAEDVTIAIQNEMANGANKVTTSTGFTFDDTGLTVSKSNSEMETTITEDGMKIYKNEEEVLVANNVGVQARNLHATTYLIIGNYSRFEDYTNQNGEARTGCFWIGG